MTKQKAMKGTWSHSDESNSEEDEEIEDMTNLCLMAKDNDSSSDEDEDYTIFTLLMNCKMLLMNLAGGILL